MRRVSLLAAVAAALFCAASASAATVVYDFEDGTDQGFGNKFSNDASASFPIVTIGGSKRMEVLRNGDFQEADRGSSADAGFLALDAAMNNPSNYVISYDWYVDTSLSPGNYGTYLQLGTYINSNGPNPNYLQDFPGVKDAELNGTQLASGSVFSGTVSETVTAKYGVPPAANFIGTTFLRLGLIVNGDGAAATVYFDNIRVQPVVPEPVTLALFSLAAPALLCVRRRK